MPIIEFAQNYSDLSTDQGFQSRFHCDHGGNGYMSSFVPNKLETAGNLLRAVSSLFGGVFGNAGESAYDLQRAGGGPQHDRALQNAVQEVKPRIYAVHALRDVVLPRGLLEPGKGFVQGVRAHVGGRSRERAGDGDAVAGAGAGVGVGSDTGASGGAADGSPLPPVSCRDDGRQVLPRVRGAFVATQIRL